MSRLARQALPLLVLSLGAAFAQDKETKNFLWLGDMNSRYNQEVLWMSIPAIILSILIFFGTAGALFYSVIKFRERPGDTREAAQFHGNNTLEIALIVVPLIIVTLLAILTVRTMARVNSIPQNALNVDVLGRQFWWNFTYPKEMGGFTNGNELVVPAGRPIALSITSGDVIHAFWAPNLGGQRDAIPGVVKNWTIDISKPGIYQGNCTVLCGASHANMRFKVAVLPENDFAAFTKAAQTYKAPAPTTESQQRGYTLFMQGKPETGAVSCASCHRVQGTPAGGVAGPDLSFYASRNTLGAGMWEGEAARRMLKPWILNSPKHKPGSLMPAYQAVNKESGEVKNLLTEQDLDDLVAYMNTLKLPAEAQYWNKLPSR